MTGGIPPELPASLRLHWCPAISENDDARFCPPYPQILPVLRTCNEITASHPHIRPNLRTNSRNTASHPHLHPILRTRSRRRPDGAYWRCGGWSRNWFFELGGWEHSDAGGPGGGTPPGIKYPARISGPPARGHPAAVFVYFVELFQGCKGRERLSENIVTFVVQ